MKRRVLLFNTIVIFTSLAVLLAVSGLITRQVMGAYAARGAASASETTAQVRELLDGWAGSGERWQSLDLQLGALGYGLHVTWYGREAYSSLDAVQEDLLHQNSAVSWPEGESCLVWLGGTPAVGLRSGAYVLVAVDAANVPEVFGRQRPQLEAMLLSLAITGATAIAVIVALSLVSTHFLVRLLLRPVNALADAARRVEAGDYTQPVGYAGQDEFTAVCAAFEQMQRHLLEEREKNAAYERARTDLVAGISHDLRTPLTSVQGCLKGLLDGVAGTPEKRAQYLDIAYRKACDMEVLLQRLFDFSRLETGGMPFFPERADLGDFARRFARENEAELERRGGRFVLRGAPAPHPVRMDPGQMARVLNNLTDNAVRYAGVRPLVLTLTVWRDRDMEKLRFADNGRGVPDGELPHLFEQFWRGDLARRDGAREGSGLGLYLVKYILEAHGGSVTARVDGGLVFELALPCEEEPYAQHSDRGG